MRMLSQKEAARRLVPVSSDVGSALEPEPRRSCYLFYFSERITLQARDSNTPEPAVRAPLKRRKSEVCLITDPVSPFWPPVKLCPVPTLGGVRAYYLVIAADSLLHCVFF